jgi:hypothetical protein
MINPEKAIEQYQKHLERVRKYNHKNKERLREISKVSFENLKSNPEKYEKYKQKKRDYYHRRKAKLLSEDNQQTAT